MANRPVYASVPSSPSPVWQFNCEFVWNAGLSKSQRKKNVKALHEAFIKRKGGKSDVASQLLEVSSLSENTLGINLSAFNLQLDVEALMAKLEGRVAEGSKVITVEMAYQGGKCISGQGPFTDIWEMGSKAAKRDPRLRSGPITGFKLGNTEFPLAPASCFYDFLYLSALTQPQNKELLEQAVSYMYFTDINFNPNKGVSNQAQALALGVALYHKGVLEQALSDLDSFLKLAYR